MATSTQMHKTSRENVCQINIDQTTKVIAEKEDEVGFVSKSSVTAAPSSVLSFVFSSKLAQATATCPHS